MENGKAALAEGLENGIGFGSTEFHVIRPGPKITGKWLHTLVRHQEFKNDAAKYFKGTAGQQRVPKGFLEKKIVPIPSIPEQDSIIDYLNNLQKDVDELRHLQNETSKELDRLMPSILYNAFNDK